MTNDGQNTLAYDAAGQLITTTANGATATYSYDCKSLRVKKVSGGTTTVYIFSGGKVIAEYVNGAAPTAPAREYIYSGSTMLAQIENGATTYFHPDHLSPRLLTDASGNLTGQQGHFPFGEMWYDSGATKWKFTSYERDDESGNDYAMARYDVSRLGRFNAPDPMSGSMVDPQSLNRYSYVANDPVNYHDPSGQFLTALTLFLDRWDFPQFGENWDEFHFIEPRQTGTLYWFRSNTSSFTFEGLDTDTLLGDAADGEIQLIKEWPMFADPIMINPAMRNPGTLPPGFRDRARILLSNADCAKFLKKVLQGEKQLPDLDEFLKNFDAAQIIPTPHPDADGGPSRPDTTAHRVPSLVTNTPIHVDAPDAPDLSETLLHEVFHGSPYGMHDRAMAAAAGLGDFKTDNAASRAFSKEMSKHCHN